MSSNIKSLIHVSSLTLMIFHLAKSQLDRYFKILDERKGDFGQQPTFNISLCVILLLTSLPIPHMILNFLGLLLLNTFPTRVNIRKRASERLSDLKLPMICFRVMTKGCQRDKVVRHLTENYHTCLKTGLGNFVLEYLTEDENLDLNIDIFNRDRQVGKFRKLVVPRKFQTPANSSYRARLLQYALEADVNQLARGDYIVHLDEDIIMSQDFIRGLINFIRDDKHPFGKPNIVTYGHEQLFPSLSQLMETMRISDSMGRSRFQLQILNKPIYSIQGNCFVAKYEAELDVGFNYGPLESVFYDFNFAMRSMEKNYSWSLIDGHVRDQSDPVVMNNVIDIVKQRKGFVDAMCLMAHSNRVPFRHKLLFSLPLYAWLSFPILVLISMIDTTPRPVWMDSIELFCLYLTVYMHLFGVVLLFDFKGIRILMLPLFFTGTMLAFILAMMIDLFVITYTLITTIVQTLAKLKHVRYSRPTSRNKGPIKQE